MSCAIITGASSGIGREIALKIKEMTDVDEFWLVARNEERLRAVADELAVPYKIICADLSSSEGLEVYRAALSEAKPDVAFLVNAAGFGVFGTFETIPEKTVSDMIDLNVKATVLITQMTVPYMKRGGRIIQLGSGSCFTPLPHFNVYSSSKVFVLHYTKSLNFELKPYGIRATCFCPGWVDTPFLGKSVEAKGVMAPKKMSPLLNPEKVARGCVRAAIKGKTMYVTNWYTKMQHMLFKLVPDPILTRIWLSMLEKKG